MAIGIGWDLGYHNVSELRSTWEELGNSTLHRLDIGAGKKGTVAQTLIGQLRLINVPGGCLRAGSRKYSSNVLLPICDESFSRHHTASGRGPGRPDLISV